MWWPERCASTPKAAKRIPSREAGHVGGRNRSRVPAEELLDRVGMQPGQLVLDLGNRTDTAENRPQLLAKFRGIGERERGTRDHPVAAVRLDHCDIDPVQ